MPFIFVLTQYNFEYFNPLKLHKNKNDNWNNFINISIENNRIHAIRCYNIKALSTNDFNEDNPEDIKLKDTYTQLLKIIYNSNSVNINDVFKYKTNKLFILKDHLQKLFNFKMISYIVIIFTCFLIFRRNKKIIEDILKNSISIPLTSKRFSFFTLS